MAPFATPKEIDPVDVEYGFDPENLSDAEKRFLQDHELLDTSKHEPVPVVFYTPDGTAVSNDPAYFAQMEVQNHDRFQQMVESRARQIAEELVKNEQHETVTGNTPYHGNALNEPAAGGSIFPPIVNPDPEELDEVEEDYEDGWNNDRRRAELSARGLPIHGSKEEMIARLKADDAEDAEAANSEEE